MKKQFDPYQMTFRQFFLFLIIGGIALIWLVLEISMLLKTPGDGSYKVNSRLALELHLSGSEHIYLPDNDLLPKGDNRLYSVVTYSSSKLTRQKDGYILGISNYRGSATVCTIRCDSRDPDGNPPFPVRADQVRQGVDVQIDAYGDIVHIQFVLEGYLYSLFMPHLEDSPTPFDEFTEILLKITDDILRQAG